ncbi:hypothetical protein Kisp01_62260 [Kineosporia sp. NBRC 101677]|nr:hypothetical protein Kisp01_62260 [Kineosporia sp. NBRC 101677]
MALLVAALYWTRLSTGPGSLLDPALYWTRLSTGPGSLLDPALYWTWPSLGSDSPLPDPSHYPAPTRLAITGPCQGRHWAPSRQFCSPAQARVDDVYTWHTWYLVYTWQESDHTLRLAAKLSYPGAMLET